MVVSPGFVLFLKGSKREYELIYTYVINHPFTPNLDETSFRIVHLVTSSGTPVSRLFRMRKHHRDPTVHTPSISHAAAAAAAAVFEGRPEATQAAFRQRRPR